MAISGVPNTSPGDVPEAAEPTPSTLAYPAPVVTQLPGERGDNDRVEMIDQGDLNDDDVVDLAVLRHDSTGGSTSTSVLALLGNGDGTFTVSADISLTTASGIDGGVVIGQFSNDSVPDIVVATDDSTTVPVYFGVGDGTFTGPGTLGVPTPSGAARIGPHLIRSADMEGDLDDDLVVAFSNQVAVIRNNGTGGFPPPERVDTDVGDINDLVIADLDDNGRQDLIVAGPTGLQVFSQDLAGDFAETADLPGPAGYGNGFTAAVVGEFTGDDDLDVVVGRGDNSDPNGVGVMAGGGDGTLVAPAAWVDVPGNRGPRRNGDDHLAEDLDGDGHLDAVFTTTGTADTTATLFGDGAAGLSLRSWLTTAADGALGDNSTSAQVTTNVLVADVDDDARPDLVVGADGGVFSSINVVLADPDDARGWLTAPTFPVFDEFDDGPSVLLADFTGDDEPDILTAPPAGGLWVTPGLGDGRFDPPYQASAVESCYFGYLDAAGDFDDDGNTDFVCHGDKPVVYFGDGAGGVDSVQVVDVGDSVTEFHLTTDTLPVDMDGVGGDELVVMTNRTVFGVAPLAPAGGGFVESGPATDGTTVQVFGYDDGEGALVALSQVEFGPPQDLGQDWTYGLVAGAFDAGGTIDLSTWFTPSGSSTAHRVFIPGDGAGGLGTPTTTDTGLPYDDYVASRTGDFDEDGDLDIVSVGSSATDRALLVELGNGDGTFGVPDDFPTTAPGSGDFTGLAVADIDGDGHVDVVADGHRTIEVHLGAGDGTLAAPIHLQRGNTFGASVAVADLDGDSSPDIVADAGRAGAVVHASGGDPPATIPDLEVVDVDLPAPPVRAGDEVTVTVTVENAGTAAALGQWRDEVVVETSRGAYSLGSALVRGPLLPGETAVSTITGFWPATVPGNTEVVANTDVGGAVAESDEGDNASTGIVSTTVDVLPVETTVDGSVAADSERLHRIEIAGDAAVLSVTGSSAVRMATALGAVPDDDQLTALAAETVLGPGTHYLLLAGTSTAGGGAAYRLHLAALVRGIESVAPSQVGRGPVTFTVVGAGFGSDAAVELRGDSETIADTDVSRVSSTRLFVTVDLTDANLGDYDVAVLTGGEEYVLPDAVSVVDAEGARFEVFVSAPETARLFRSSPLQITVLNAGGLDALAPVVRVSADTARLARTAAGPFVARGVDLLAVGDDGSLVLAPGESAHLTLRFHPDPEVESDDPMNFTARAYGVSNTTPWSWTSAEDRLRPEGLDDAVWTEAYAAFLAEVGDTAGSHALALHSMFAELDELGIASYRAADLHRRIIDRAIVDVAGADLFGTAVDDAGPVVERDVLAVSPNGQISQTTTTIDGAFAFHDLPDGSYEVSVRDTVPVPAGFAQVPREASLDLVVAAPVTLIGRVRTPDGDGAGGAAVTVERVGQEGHGIASAQADASGRYRVTDLVPGELRVVAAVPGFLGATDAVDAITAGPYTVPDLMVTTGLAVAGIVTNSDGLPVEGAWVAARGADDRTSNLATTAADGSYEVTGLPTGPVEVAAALDDVGQATTSVDLPVGGSVDLQFEAGGTISGTVTSGAGGIVIGAVVITDAVRIDEIRTAADGSYQVDGVPTGDSLVEVRAPGYAPTRVSVTVLEDDTVTADVVLAPLGVLEVTVLDGTTPLADVPVTATFVGGLGGTIRTGADGVATLADLVPGQYVVHAGTTAGPDTTRALVDVVSGANTLTLEADLAHVTGVVLDPDDDPVPDAAVAAIVDGEPLLRTTTASDGSFLLRIEPGTTVNLLAVAPDGSVAGAYDVAVGATADPPIGMTTGSSSLEVTATGPTGPAGSVELRLDLDGLGEVARTRTSAAGIATFDGLPDGPWTILAGGPELAPDEFPGVLAGSDSVELTFSEGRSVSGQVLDGVGDPVADVLVGATDGASGQTVVTVTDDSGDWTLASLSPGAVTLRTSNGADIVEADVDVSAASLTGVDLVLDGAGAVVEGVVSDPSGTPLLGRIVQLVRNGLPVGLTTTGSDGAYRFDGVPDGAWSVVVTLGGASSTVENITVPATGTLEVDVTTEPAIGWDVQPAFELAPPGEVMAHNASIEQVGPTPFALRSAPRSAAFPELAWFGEAISGLPPPQKNTWADNNLLKWRDYQDKADPINWDCPDNAVYSLESELRKSENAVNAAYRHLQETHGAVEQVYTAGMGEVLSKGAYNGLKTWVTLSSIAGGGTATTTVAGPGGSMTIVQADQAANALAGVGLPVIDLVAGTTGNAVFNGNGSIETDTAAGTVVGVGGGVIGLAGGEATSSILGTASMTYDWVKFKDEVDELTDSQISTLVTYSQAEDFYLAAVKRHQQLTNTFVAATGECDPDPPEDEPEDENGDGPEDDEGGGGGGGEGPPEPPDDGPGDNPSPPRPTKDRGPDGQGEGTSLGGASLDPNEIVGPPGVGAPGWIAVPADLGYSISFENEPAATLPATIVTVTTELDDDTDWSTFELGDMGWGDILVDVPDGVQQWTAQVPLPGTDNVVDVEAGLDIDTGLVTWVLTTIDPAIDDIPDDAGAGFLPPNSALGCDGAVEPHCGEGFIEYSVAPASTDTGTEISAQADIIFDENDPIVTNLWINTIDSSRPVADLVALPATSLSPEITLDWTADDEGSGAVAFDLLAQVDGSALFLYRSGLTGSSTDVPVEVGKTYGFALIASDAVGLQEAVLAGPEVMTEIVDDSNDGEVFVSLEPSRFANSVNELTFDGLYANTGARAGGTFWKIKIADRGGVPDTAVAAIMNVTATGATSNGNVRVYPCTSDVPTVSSINFRPGTTEPNEVIAKLSGTGHICIWVSSTVHILVDVVGYVDVTSPYTPIDPARYAHSAKTTTFDGQYAATGPIDAETFWKIKIAGRGDIPATAKTVAVNVTVTNPQGSGNLRVYPCTATPPTASSLNYTAGLTRPNELVAKLSDDGHLCIWSKATADVIVDAVGYLDDAPGYTPVEPVRYAHSANTTTFDGLYAATGPIDAETFWKIKIAGRGTVPSDATTVAVNVTVTNPQANGNLRVYPCTPDVPTASSLNYTPGLTRPNELVAKLSDDGHLCIWSKATADAIIDIVGHNG